MNNIEKYYEKLHGGRYDFRKIIYLHNHLEGECVSVFQHINMHNAKYSTQHDTVNDFCTLFLFMQGHSNLIINGETFYATNGTVLAKCDGELHRPYSYVSGEIIYYGINFPTEYIKQLKGKHFLYDMFYRKEKKAYRITNPKDLEEIIEHFNRIKNNQEENDLLLYSYVIQLVHKIYDAVNKPERKTSQSVVSDATAYMTENFKTITSIDDIAAHCNVSTSYLCRVIKKKLNCTLNDILINLRMENSIELLKRGHSVMDAAANSGFKNYQYYVTLFKKRYGQTPLKYISNLNKTIYESAISENR